MDFNTLATNFDPSGAAPPHDWTDAEFDNDDDVVITDFNSLATNFCAAWVQGKECLTTPQSLYQGE